VVLVFTITRVIGIMVRRLGLVFAVRVSLLRTELVIRLGGTDFGKDLRLRFTVRITR